MISDYSNTNKQYCDPLIKPFLRKSDDLLVRWAQISIRNSLKDQNERCTRYDRGMNTLVLLDMCSFDGPVLDKIRTDSIEDPIFSMSTY